MEEFIIDIQALIGYGKCPKWSDLPEGAVWLGSTLFTIPSSILSNKLYKKQNLEKKYGIRCSKF